jgi:RNase H-fold protein (predicted Holliday junction resolvase)
MNFNNQGNIKIVSLVLSLIGITTFFVTQGKSIQNQPNELIDDLSEIEKSYYEVKTIVVEKPLSFVEDSKRMVEEIQIFQTDNKQSSSIVVNTLPETKITKLTSQMVENCKIITDEYNKLKEGNQIN